MAGLINPTSISFTYKKGQVLPPSFLITHDYNEVPVYENKPSWINIFDITALSLKVSLNSNVNNITAGTYNETAIIKRLILPGNIGVESPSSLFINLVLTDTQLLEVTPSNGDFNFEIGGTTPVDKFFNVLSESLWITSKNATWITINNGNGNSNGSFSVSVNPAGLSPGVYSDDISVDDGGISILVRINLTITDPDTGGNFLSIFPVELNFGFTENGALPASQNIDINASDNFTITTADAWVSLSASNGVAGPSSVAVSLQNLSALSVGSHIGYVDFVLATIVKRVTVHLTIYQLVTESLISGKLYFADDINNIKVSSSRNDTNLLMNIATSFEGKSFNIPYRIPFFTGVATKRIGAEAKNIISERPIHGLADSSIFTPYLPLVMDITTNEVEIITNAIVQSTSVQNIKFLKGQKPTSNLLSNVPDTIFLTKKGILLFSVLSNGLASGDLTITGATQQTISGDNQIFDYYTVILPLSSLSNLITGDTFKVSLLDQSVTVIIIDDNLDHALLFAESQWGVFEAVELTGEIQETDNYKSKSFRFKKGHLSTETRVYEQKIKTTFKINTGYIYTNQMIDYLQILLGATNYYLQTPSGFRKVKNTTRRIVTRKTLRQAKHADLTFEDIIE